MRSKLSAWDRSVFQRVAERHWPGGDRVLPALSHSANHGVLWFAVAAGAAVAGRRPARRAALRGMASLAVASATVNTIGKRSVRRSRPLQDAVPLVRRLSRQPFTTSFPSGHSASAVAFTTGVMLENRSWGLALAPLAAAVCFSRVYTGVHYPGDVVAGALLGAGAAFAVRGVAPTRSQLAPPARPRADAPALPGGRGLVVVANGGSGQRAAAAARPDPVELLRSALPHAEIVSWGGDADETRRPLSAALEEAAARAAELGGALGVHGGDGTVNAAAGAALRHGLPLAVLPGGTHNHFAYDLGIESVADACRAMEAGEAVAVDVTRFGRNGCFLNTFSLGAYPELVRVRERWAPRIGTWPAGLLAAVHILRTARPVRLRVDGRERRLWMLFAGNCTYHGLGLAPVRRHDLADGVLDVRLVHGGRLARTRLLAAALTGGLRHSPVLRTARVRKLHIGAVGQGTHLAYDGEVAPAPEELTLTKVNEALVVYRVPDE
ncbi:bifunctional phosphatase PAP2/diacylglycerol kinase family protein [Streptomyces cinnamoneus]|uniref:Phosphoesterase n=1 Tax=Streptomyces cinnamoneus TaxID=53446 RepID=A0A918WH19_STRCJ|nr:phosphatase PAP2 family protein [Streptomyces cinnamoneus]GHC45939.1 phosphoesterase [Streptomyces cinnamoneus]